MIESVHRMVSGVVSLLAQGTPGRTVLLGICVVPYFLSIWAMVLLREQTNRKKKVELALDNPNSKAEQHAKGLWNYEITLVDEGLRRSRNFAHLFGFTSSISLGACVLLFLSFPLLCADGTKVTGIAGVSIATGVAIAVATALALGRIFVRIANNDASPRLFANAFRSLTSTIIAGFAIASLLFVTRQSDLISQTLGYVVIGALIGVWGERALDYFLDRAEALIKAPAITEQKRADLNLIDGLTEEDLMRLAEEGIDSLHALAFVPTPRLFFNTKYSLQRICDLQDQALLVKYVGPDKNRSFRANLLIRGAMDLRELAIAILCRKEIETSGEKQYQVWLRTRCESEGVPPAAVAKQENVPNQGQAGGGSVPPPAPAPVPAAEPMPGKPGHDKTERRMFTISKAEWDKMFNLLGFGSAEQGVFALSNIVDDELIKRLRTFYEAIPCEADREPAPNTSKQNADKLTTERSGPTNPEQRL